MTSWNKRPALKSIIPTVRNPVSCATIPTAKNIVATKEDYGLVVILPSNIDVSQ